MFYYIASSGAIWDNQWDVTVYVNQDYVDKHAFLYFIVFICQRVLLGKNPVKTTKCTQ